jgi:hypothetical protein
VAPKITLMAAPVAAPPSPRALWTQGARQNLLDQREKRRDMLKLREPALTAGCARFGIELQQGVRPSHVGIRPGMFFTEVPLETWDVDPSRDPRRSVENPTALSAEVASRVARRAPLGQVVNRRGAAAPLFVAAVGVAGLRGLPGDPVDLGDIANSGRASWAKLIGDGDHAGVARRHVVDGVKRLRGLGVVRLRDTISKRPGFAGWALLQEDGSEAEFVVPNSLFQVPVEFWVNGWAAVLTPPEVLAYFMVLHAARLYPGAHAAQGVGIPPATRQQRYGVTRSTYATLNELEEFGLVKRATERQPGVADEAKPREVDRFQLTRKGLQKNAFVKVTEALSQKQTPLRLAHYDSDLQLFKSVLAALPIT